MSTDAITGCSVPVRNLHRCRNIVLTKAPKEVVPHQVLPSHHPTIQQAFPSKPQNLVQLSEKLRLKDAELGRDFTTVFANTAGDTIANRVPTAEEVRMYIATNPQAPLLLVNNWLHFIGAVQSYDVVAQKIVVADAHAARGRRTATGWL
jgi:hypothetical protein